MSPKDPDWERRHSAIERAFAELLPLWPKPSWRHPFKWMVWNRAVRHRRFCVDYLTYLGSDPDAERAMFTDAT